MLYQSAGSSRERERRVIGHLRPHVRQRNDGAVLAARGARHATHLASFVQQWRVVVGQLVELEDAQPAVRMAAEVQPRYRLLTRVAALRERDVRLVEARLRGKDPVVDLALPAWNSALDPPQLDLFFRERRRETGVEPLACPGPVCRESLSASERKHRLVLLGLDLALRAQTHPREVRQYGVAQPWLGEHEEVLVGSPQDYERRDHSCLGREEKRRA